MISKSKSHLVSQESLVLALWRWTVAFSSWLIPIVMFQAGSRLTPAVGMLLVAVYLVSFSLSSLLFRLWWAKPNSVSGARSDSLVLGLLGMVATWALVSLTLVMPILAVFAGACFGLATQKMAASQLPTQFGSPQRLSLPAWLQVAASLLLVFAPVLGGYGTRLVGLDGMGLMVMSLLLLGVCLVFSTDSRKDKKRPLSKLANLPQLMQYGRRHWRTLLPTILSHAWLNISNWLWPLYVYLVLGSVERVGELLALTAFGVFLWRFFIGVPPSTHFRWWRWLSRWSRVGAWLLRLFVPSLPLFLASAAAWEQYLEEPDTNTLTSSTPSPSIAAQTQSLGVLVAYMLIGVVVMTCLWFIPLVGWGVIFIGSALAVLIK